jgi:uncharacterized protein YjiS (DUF1127 family)
MLVSTDLTTALNGITFLGTSGSSRLARLRANFTARRAEQRRRNRIVTELSRYTDRELADLGFSRADFPAIASGTYMR